MSMEQTRVAFPFTFLFKREDGVWAALACEVDVASCGDTLDEARKALKDAVELYVVTMLEEGGEDRISRPVPRAALAEFMGDDPQAVTVEHLTMIAQLAGVPLARVTGIEFVRSMVAPVDCTRAATH
jgi:predicted RNase H-like HicB family nuclease